jgi:hypothetical protein
MSIIFFLIKEKQSFEDLMYFCHQVKTLNLLFLGPVDSNNLYPRFGNGVRSFRNVVFVYSKKTAVESSQYKPMC